MISFSAGYIKDIAAGLKRKNTSMSAIEYVTLNILRKTLENHENIMAIASGGLDPIVLGHRFVMRSGKCLMYIRINDRTFSHMNGYDTIAKDLVDHGYIVETTEQLDFSGKTYTTYNILVDLGLRFGEIEDKP